MSGPNRKLRRAMEAQARKAKTGPPVSPDDLAARQTIQRMYDARTMEVQHLERQLARQQAMTAGIMVELDMEEVKITQATLDALAMGVVEGFNPIPLEDGVLIELVFSGEEDGDDDSEAE